MDVNKMNRMELKQTARSRRLTWRERDREFPDCIAFTNMSTIFKMTFTSLEISPSKVQICC